MSVATRVVSRPKMTIETQMKVSQWLFKNTAILDSMTLEEIAGAVNGQAGLTQTIPLHSVRRLMEAANLPWKPKTSGEERLKLRAMYDKMLTLQGRIEQQEAQIEGLLATVAKLSSRTDAIISNSQWIADAPEGNLAHG